MNALRPILVVMLWLAALRPCQATPVSLTDEALGKIRFEQKLNAQVPPQLSFRDEDGRVVRLGDYLGGKPIILVLGYYRCPMLCTLTLNGLVEASEDLKWSIGRDFDVLNVSIDPTETSTLAAAKKQAYVKRYGRAGAAAGWHFLTGDSPAIEQLCHTVGFAYVYDRAARQFAHPSGLVILTPTGRVSGYLFGVTFKPTDLFAALQHASENRIGSRIQELILLCFHYSPLHGRYSGLVVRFLRIFGTVTLLGVFALVAFMIRAEGKKAELAALGMPASGSAPPQTITPADRPV